MHVVKSQNFHMKTSLHPCATTVNIGTLGGFRHLCVYLINVRNHSRFFLSHAVFKL